MAERQQVGVPSTAAIAGHPIHPMLIPFPVASLVGVLVSDLIFSANGNTFWAEASRWLLLVGVVTGALAAIFGLIDFLTIRRVREYRIAWIHFLGNAAAIVLSLINLLLRPNPTDGIPTVGIILSVVVALILVVTGWLGGELSYRHKIGVLP